MDILKPIIDPTLTFDQLQLNSFIGDSEQERIRSAETTTQNAEALTGKNVTTAESDVIDLRIQQQIRDLVAIEDRVSKIQSFIDKSITENGGLTIPVNVKGRPSLKRAIQRAFGVKTSEVSYDMYRSALTALQRLQDEAATEYVEQS